jgi:serine/threonine protein kinase
MMQSANAAWAEPPADAEEVILANFLDEVLERLERGETISADVLLRRTPQLIERGQQMLKDVNVLFGVGESVREQDLLLQSDLLSLFAGEVSGAADGPVATVDEPLPDPFPGEFRVYRRLGSGSFGTVWLAEDLHLRRWVALKTILVSSQAAPGPQPVEQALQRLHRLKEEAQLAASVRHRNVVEVYAWREAAAPPSGDPADPVHYLVLQYVPGGSLAERVWREGPLPWQLAARYIADIAEGLLEVHNRGIVHRDVKPANILWNAEADEAILTDFGISARLSDPTTVGGTVFYMPPEAFEGRVSPAQDVYGLAASLFWLVTGSVPFPARTPERLLAQVQRGLPTPDARFAELPRSLEQLIRAGLTADPGRRPSLSEFVVSLRGALNQLLADSLLLAPGSSPRAPVQLRLTVSRQVERHAFLPVATTQPQTERFLRDMRCVPREPERVDLRTGDRLRIEVTTDRDGYVTVFNVGPTGNLNLLYPMEQASAERSSAVPAGRPLHILDIELTPPAGRERLFALWTRIPLALRLDELRGLAERGEFPISGAYRATRDMERVQESVQRLEPADWQAVVLELNHLSTVENAS